MLWIKLVQDGDFLAWFPVQENLLRKCSPNLSLICQRTYWGGGKEGVKAS